MTNTQWNYLKVRNLFKCDGEVPNCQDWPRKMVNQLSELGDNGNNDLNLFKIFLESIRCDNEYEDNGRFIRFASGIKLFYSISDDLFAWYPYVFSDDTGKCYTIVNIRAVGPIRIPVLNKRMDKNMIFKFERNHS